MDPDFQPPQAPGRARRVRTALVVLLLTLGTTLALVVAWARPQDTVWHFWVVTQCLPLFYLALSVWAAWPLADEGSA